MTRRWNMAVAATAALALGVAGCGAPAAKRGADGGDTGKIKTATSATDANAKGPAPEVPGARKGGVITVLAQSTPNTFDPTDTYYTDSLEIGKLLFRTPTQYLIRDGQPVLVPDLTDLGTVSADKLTWTFKLQSGIKFEDGSPVTADDIAYAIKRSFAHDIFANGPTYQMTYFKDGDKYKGPYKSGDKYAGVETKGTDTLIIHLAKPFADLPFYMTFPVFAPIPKAKDKKQDYKNHPVATGPYMFDTYKAGTQLVLKRNPNWDANTDAARHAYPDGWEFKWGGDSVKTQQQVLNSAGPDANALSYEDIDASLIPQLTGEKKKQLLQGDSPCTYVTQMDTTKIPLEVRKAVAKAYPYDDIWKAAGLNSYIAEPASTFMPPSVPGYQKYTPLPDLSGQGKGDPDGAKAMLKAAGKEGFELSWYYDNTKPISQQTNAVRSEALQKAGFTVKAIGVTTTQLREKLSDYKAPVNMGQAPSGWCSDWPTGASWFPVLFQSHSVADGLSWGMMKDSALDAEIDAIADLPSEQATAKWAELDKKIMGMYVGLPRYYTKTANIMGSNIGGAVSDNSAGMPLFPNMFLKS